MDLSISEVGITVHLLAADYDTDIDHHPDEIRYHRSRINCVNAVESIGVARVIRMDSKIKPEVYLPLNDTSAHVDVDEGGCTVHLSEKCSYVLMHF